jgi:lipopolysaccharide export system permease protein
MVTKAFIPILILALVFFVLILELVDLFSNLWRYLNHDVSILQILQVALYYVPKCISFSIPISLLFAISFTLGNYYSNNELIAVFGSGISLYSFVVPMLLCGFLLSGFMFVFEEKVVIDTFEKKNKLSRALLDQQVSYSNTNVTVLSHQNRIIYHADYYNDNNKTLSGVIIVERDFDGGFLYRIDAEKAVWENGGWEFPSCRIFTWDEEGEALTEYKRSGYRDEKLDESPKTFRKSEHNIEEMKLQEAREWIISQKRSGLPYRGALTEYYQRFSFALTPLIVALISTGLGGRFKRNILLMSLLLSLIITVIYYVMQMMFVIFAKLGYLPPLAGAWATFFIFLFFSFWLFRAART